MYTTWVSGEDNNPLGLRIVVPEPSFKYSLWQLEKEQRKKYLISHSQSDPVCTGSSFLLDLQLTWEALRSGCIPFLKPLFALQGGTAEERRNSQSWQTGKQEGFEMQNGYYFSQNPSKGSSSNTQWTSLCLSSCKCVVWAWLLQSDHIIVAYFGLCYSDGQKWEKNSFFVVVRHWREKSVLVSIGKHPRSLWFQFSFHSINETGCEKSQIFPINLKPFSRLASNYNNIHI